MSLDPLSIKLLTEHPADGVRVLEKLSTSDLIKFFETLSQEVTLKAFPYLTPYIAIEVIEKMSPEKAANLLQKSDPEYALLLLRKIDEHPRENILEFLPTSIREQLLRSLAFHENTVGSLMTTRFLTLPVNLSVLDAKNIMSRVPEKNISNYLYVLDESHHLQGLVTSRQLFSAHLKDNISTIMTTDIISVSPNAPLTRVVEYFTVSERSILPVIEQDGTFIGTIDFWVVMRKLEAFMKEELDESLFVETIVSLGEAFWSVGARFLDMASPIKRGKA